MHEPTRQPSKQSQFIDLSGEALAAHRVCYDPDAVTLEGTYSDELSAYRAKRVWGETLERYFLLEKNHDFRVQVTRSLSNDLAIFQLKGNFISACARYAFWRLTNEQAPEAQYLIETAHIPQAFSRDREVASAPDLIHVSDMPNFVAHEISLTTKLISKVTQLIKKLCPEPEGH